MNIFQMAINNVNEGKERKRGRKKKLNVVLDSESVDIRINGVDMLRTAINWGIVIGDNYGNTLFERDFIISDIYNTPLRNVLNSYYIAKLQPIENDPTTEFVANFKEFYDGLRQMWLSLSVFWDLEFWSFNADCDCKAFLFNAELPFQVEHSLTFRSEALMRRFPVHNLPFGFIDTIECLPV